MLCQLEVSKRIFPLTQTELLGDRQDVSLAYSSSPWSALSLYELALASGSLLQASRFLTLCCTSDLIGGLDSPTGAVRSLILAAELLYQNLRCLSLNLAVDVMHFIFRLEDMIGCYADELLGPVDIGDTIPGYHKGNVVYQVSSTSQEGAGASVSGGRAGSSSRNNDIEKCKLADVDVEGSYVASSSNSPQSSLSTVSSIPPNGNSSNSSIYSAPPSSQQSSNPSGVIGSMIAAPVRNFGIYSGSIINSMGGQIMSVSPALSYLVGGGLVWSLSKTAEAVSSPLNSIDSLRQQSMTNPAGGGKKTRMSDGDYFGGNKWCGPEMKDYVRLRGPVKLRGPVRLRTDSAAKTATQQQRRGVVIAMPVCTGYNWSAYTYLDGYYGPLGIERLFHSRLFSMSLLAHMFREMIGGGRYCSCATIALSTIPVSTESRSAFVRMLCNIEDSALGDLEKKEVENGPKGEEGERSTSSDRSQAEAPVLAVIRSILRSFRLNNLSIHQIRMKIDQTLHSSHLHALCNSEYLPSSTYGVQVVSSLLPTTDSLGADADAATSESRSEPSISGAVKAKLANMLNRPSADNNSFSASEFPLNLRSTQHEVKFTSLILGMFSAFLLINRRDVAATIAAILLNQLDIACLCLKRTALSKEESMCLLKFCVGVPFEIPSGGVEGTEELHTSLKKAMNVSSSKIVSSELLVSISGIISEQ